MPDEMTILERAELARRVAGEIGAGGVWWNPVTSEIACSDSRSEAVRRLVELRGQIDIALKIIREDWEHVP